MEPSWTLSAFLLLLFLTSFRCHSAYTLTVGEEEPVVMPKNTAGESDDDYTEPTDDPENYTGSPPPPCDYDHCRDQQVPCVALSELNGCRCPGESGLYETPDAPTLLHLTTEGSQVEVHWCAPPSAVTHYRILDGQRQLLKASAMDRRILLPDLEPGARVCVEAVNHAGSSNPTQSSCARYEPPNGGLPTTAAIIGTVLGCILMLLLLLLPLAGFLLRRYKANRRPGIRDPAHGAEGAL